MLSFLNKSLNKSYIQIGTTDISNLNYKLKMEIKSIDFDEIINIKSYLLHINNSNIEKYKELIINCIINLIKEKRKNELYDIDFLLFDIENGVASIPLFEIKINKHSVKKEYLYHRFEINKMWNI